MNIEAGDYFVVTRGFRLGDSSFIDAIFGLPVQETPPEDRYDRSHEGCVYVAEAVCGPVIAGRCIHATYGNKIGQCRSLNTNELEVWPVTKKYCEALGIKIEDEAAK